MHSRCGGWAVLLRDQTWNGFETEQIQVQIQERISFQCSGNPLTALLTPLRSRLRRKERTLELRWQWMALSELLCCSWFYEATANLGKLWLLCFESKVPVTFLIEHWTLLNMLCVQIVSCKCSNSPHKWKMILVIKWIFQLGTWDPSSLKIPFILFILFCFGFLFFTIKLKMNVSGLWVNNKYDNEVIIIKNF